MLNKLHRFLLYLTNNLEKSMHETQFDLWFFVIQTVCVIVGIPWFVIKGEPHWSVLVLYWYVQGWDQLRHNREKQVEKKKKYVEPEQRYPKDEL